MCCFVLDSYIYLFVIYFIATRLMMSINKIFYYYDVAIN